MSYEPHQSTPLATTHFDENDKKYRLCCCHIKTWTLVLGVIELISLIIQFGSSIASYVTGRNTTGSYYSGVLGSMIVGIIMLVIGIAVVILLIMGIRKIKPNWLIPHMVWQVISVIGMIIAAICYFVIAGTAKSDKKQEWKERGKDTTKMVTGVTVGGGVGLIIAALVDIFFLWIVYRCYKYLKDKVAADQGLPMGGSGGYSSVEKGIDRHTPKEGGRGF